MQRMGSPLGGDGAVFSYDGTDWSTEETPTTENLTAVILETDSTPAISVGAGGIILEE